MLTNCVKRALVTDGRTTAPIRRHCLPRAVMDHSVAITEYALPPGPYYEALNSGPNAYRPNDREDSSFSSFVSEETVIETVIVRQCKIHNQVVQTFLPVSGYKVAVFGNKLWTGL